MIVRMALIALLLIGYGYSAEKLIEAKVFRESCGSSGASLLDDLSFYIVGYHIHVIQFRNCGNILNIAPVGSDKPTYTFSKKDGNCEVVSMVYISPLGLALEIVLYNTTEQRIEMCRLEANRIGNRFKVRVY